MKKTDKEQPLAEKETHNFTHVALGIFKNETTGKWAIMEIPYDPVAVVADIPKVVNNEEGNKESAVVRYKIASVKQILNK